MATREQTGLRADWYPVAFVADLHPARPHAFSIRGVPLVLFMDPSGEPAVLADRCPHRSARLSDGIVVDGRVECGYHGWRFVRDGRCTEIPQLPSDHDIPAGAHATASHAEVHQGMVWVWTGDASDADSAAVPVVDALEVPGIHRVDFVMDLPYDQSYLIENVIDVAHIHIAHDGTRGGGRRELASPLAFEITESSERGFVARYRSTEISETARSTSLRGAEVAFVAPGLVRYTSLFDPPDRHAGLALYCLPMGPGRCRLLYRAYNSFPPSADRRRPRWREHLSQCRLLEEDLAVVIGQSVRLSEAGGRPEEMWLPLATSDKLVLRFRRWLADQGQAIPPKPTSTRMPDRFDMHTRLCADCTRAHRACKRLRPVLSFAVVCLLAAGVAYPASAGIWALAAVLTALAGRAVQVTERRFV